MVHWAEQIGPHTARLFERILAEKPHPEMGYRSCLGIIRLAEQYSAARMEAESIELAGAEGFEPSPSSLTVRCPTSWTTPQRAIAGEVRKPRDVE
jgi:hypothetical protein